MGSQRLLCIYGTLQTLTVRGFGIPYRFNPVNSYDVAVSTRTHISVP